MKAGWKRVKLGDVGRIVGGATPSTREASNYGGDISWISPKDLSGYADRYIEHGERNITQVGFDSCSTEMLPKGSVLFSSRAPIGYVAIAANELCTNQGFKSLIPDSSIIDGLFAYYLLVFNKDRIEALGSGTTFKEVSASVMRQVDVVLPPLPVQRRIAAVLGALDDKIELNRKMNANLEAQAQALFKSWFVDFAPWGGKMPKEWKMGTLGELVEAIISGDWGKDLPEGKNQEPVFCIRGADIPDVKFGNEGKMPKRYVLPTNYAKKHLVTGDIVVEISGGSPTQSTGRSALVTQGLLSRFKNRIVCTNFCKAIKPRQSYSSYLYYLWNCLYDVGAFFNYENGTTGIKNLSVQGVLDNEECVIPSEAAACEFAGIIEKLHNLIFSNGMQCKKLAETRDALLPKLMSGELEVG